MKVTTRCLYPIALSLLSTLSASAQCGTCTYTETALEGSSPLTTIPAGTSVCITTNTCLGSQASYPATCANPGPGGLTVNGILRICDGVTLNYAGTITGSGTIQIMNGARLSIYGTYSCGVQITAVDPSLLSGTDLSTPVGPCSSTSCQPTFPDGYSPFGVIAGIPGYNVAGGPCTITGVTENYVLPLQLTSWTAWWQGSDILLSWSTSSADQAYKYVIDYSSDGQTWQTLSTTIPGANAAASHDYSYLFTGPFAAHNFFRLHWQDPSGRVTYSPVKELDAGDPGPDAFFAGPNPVQSTLTVRVTTANPGAYTLQVLDVTGAPRRQFSANPAGTYSLEGLAAGMYLLVVRFNDGTHWIKKITKL